MRSDFRLLGGAAVLAVLLTACDGMPTQQQHHDNTLTESSTPVTFSSPVKAEITAVAHRVPPDSSAPATEPLPGEARAASHTKNPYAGDEEAIKAGERHFAAFNCVGCHAPLGGGGIGPPLSDEKWIYGGEPEQIFLSIMHGRPNGMPAWSGMLKEKTVWELVAFIETLDEIEDHAKRKGFEERPRFEQSNDGS